MAPRLHNDISSQLHNFPDPVPGEEGHYKEFSEVFEPILQRNTVLLYHQNEHNQLQADMEFNLVYLLRLQNSETNGNLHRLPETQSLISYIVLLNLVPKKVPCLQKSLDFISFHVDLNFRN